MSFQACYRGDTLRAYSHDLRYFLRWCSERGVAPLQAQRPHLELYLRWMEQQATIGRRCTTVAGLYRYAVIDGHCVRDPSLAVTRPRVPWEGQRRSLLHPHEYAALLTAARRDSPTTHTLVAPLGMIGLGEAVSIDVTDLRSQSGYELLTIMGKGAKPALIPLPVPVLWAVRDTIAGRTSGPLLLNRYGDRLSRQSAASHLTRLARAASLTQPLSPHTLRRTFCTAGLVSRVPLRDMQYAMRHADSRTTLRYDMARANLDRHAAHAVAAYLAGMSAN